MQISYGTKNEAIETRKWINILAPEQCAFFKSSRKIVSYEEEQAGVTCLPQTHIMFRQKNGTKLGRSGVNANLQVGNSWNLGATVH